MAMSDEHKQALAEGRRSSRAVKEYLTALEEHAPKRGRKRTPDSIRARLEKIEAELGSASSIAKLQLIQERMDLSSELDVLENGGVDLQALESGFVEHAKAYSDAKGISYAAWREFGVQPKVPAAGIGRSV